MYTPIEVTSMVVSISQYYRKGGPDDVAVTDGGTDDSTAAGARVNLGITIYDTATHDAESHENIATVLSPTDHSTTDHSLIPTHPTPAGIGSNRQVLGGALVLTNASPTIQYLEPSIGIIGVYGQDRAVRLPVVGTANPIFFIFNTGALGNLIIENNAGTIGHYTVFSGSGIRVWSDGTDYAFEDLGFLKSDLNSIQTWPYGNNVNQGGDYLYACGEADETNNGLTSSRYHVMTNTGTLKFLSWRSQEVASTFSFDIYVDDVLAGSTETMTGRWGQVGIPGNVAVVAGQRVSFLMQGNVPNEMTAYLGVATRGSGAGGLTLSWGGHGSSAGTGFTNMIASRADIGGNLPDHVSARYRLPYSGNAVGFSWYTSTGTVGTNARIYKNGVSAWSGALTGASGFLATPFSVAINDDIALAVWESGTDPNDTHSSLVFDMAAKAYFVGGVFALNTFYTANAPANKSAPASATPDENHEVTIQEGGRLSIGWSSELSGSADPWRLFKNGILAATFGAMNTDRGTVVDLINVVRGDRLSVASSVTGTATGWCQFMLAVVN
jgi:hypothetical protein